MPNRHAAAHRNASASSQSLPARISRAATGRGARIAYVVMGTAGLAALAVALIGPRRLRQEILDPARSALGDQAERLWSEAQPLRSQMKSLFDRVQTEASRDRLVKSFQSWIGHFRTS